ncbi:MAG: hypothetical protein Q8O75_00035 [bacterium]|nr:hypothetical protein [bacterium]
MERPKFVNGMVREAGHLANSAIETAPSSLLFGGGLVMLSGRLVEGFAIMIGSVGAEGVVKVKRRIVEKKKNGKQEVS